jgi:hypothetical protein
MTLAAVIGGILAITLWVGIGLVILRIRSRPFRALGVLVAGMAVHNLIIMVLVRAGTNAVLIRAVQAWKEIVLLLLFAGLIAAGWQRLRSGARPRLVFLDWIVFAFAALLTGYFVVQLVLGLGDATLAQRLLSVRESLLLPVLYACGRVFLPRTSEDAEFTRGAILVSAAFVGVFGLWELWFVPTGRWLEWGAIDFSRWLGFDYHGPAGLPENFFLGTTAGLGLRRMVSTYISPLGIAYTGLLVAPLAAATIVGRAGAVPRWAAWALFTLLVSAIVFSVTRLALASLVVEFILLALLFRNWRAWLLAAIVIAAVGTVFTYYRSFGPLMTYELQEVESPTRFLRASTAVPTPSADTTGEIIDRVLSQQDASVRGHINAIIEGLRYVIEHPLGTGPGSAIPRYGETQGPGESAMLRTGGELGIIGAALYLAMYLGAMYAGWRAFRFSRGLARDFAVVALIGGIGLVPVMLTSDVWGNFSVTFLFWWAAGLSVTLAARSGTGGPGSGAEADDGPVLVPTEKMPA